MAFGMPQVGGGNFRDIVKYDARAGRMFRVDRDVNTGEREQIDITDPNMKFAIDFGSIEVGYVAFSAQGPVRAMVPLGRPLPQQPQDRDDKGNLVSRQGFFVLVAGKAVDGIREWCTNAAICVNAMEELHNDFCHRPEAAAGKIPLVRIASTIPVTSGRGQQKSTNYKPVMEIVGWVDRLPDMGERTVPPPTAQTPRSTPAPQANPTPRAAPAPQAAPASQAAPAAVDDEMPF